MAIEHFAEFVPNIHPTAFIAASADVIGRVTLHEETSIWYHATLRGDINEIVIGPRSNIQDNAVIHVSRGGFSTALVKSEEPWAGLS